MREAFKTVRFSIAREEVGKEKLRRAAKKIEA
jgi:hypothetical protein